jgi:LysM repeat protein
MATKKPQKPVVTLEDFKAVEDVVEVTETPEEAVETPVVTPAPKTTTNNEYTVKAGDTWRSIADAKNLDGMKLAALNGHVRLAEGLVVRLG